MNQNDKSMMGGQTGISTARPPVNEIMDQLKHFFSGAHLGGSNLQSSTDAGKLDHKQTFSKSRDTGRSKYGREGKGEAKEEDRKDQTGDPDKRILKIPDLIGLLNDIEIPLTQLNEGLFLNLFIYALVYSLGSSRQGGQG
jgi:hypothetical protein